MTDISICPICGKEMTVVGNTTLHYECLECVKKREELMRNVRGIQHAQDYVSPECLEERVSIGWIEAIIDFILAREKEIRAEFKKDKEALLSDIRRLTKEKYDERRKVAEDIFQKCQVLIERPEMFKEQTFFGTVHISIMDLIARYIAQLNEKKVDG